MSLIVTDNPKTAADISGLLIERNLAAQEIERCHRELTLWIEEAGRLEDALERRGFIVERMTQAS